MTTETFILVIKERLADLEREIAEIRAQIGDIQAEAAQRVDVLQAALRNKDEMATRLQEIIRIEGADRRGSEIDVQTGNQVSDGHDLEPVKLADAAYALLAESRRAYHYRDLARELMSRGVVIKGRDPATNLIAHLVHDDRFIRPQRGVYALKELNPKTRSVGRRKRKAVVKASRTATKRAS